MELRILKLPVIFLFNLNVQLQNERGNLRVSVMSKRPAEVLFWQLVFLKFLGFVRNVGKMIKAQAEN